MKWTPQDGDRDTDSDQGLSSPNIRLSDTDRLEGFSDGVLSITITLLVFDVVRPEYEPGHLLEKLQVQWPNYVAFLTSFFYVGIIWLNHRAVFSRVRYCSRSLHLANLLLLLTSALIPFPTAVLSTALQNGSRVDATVAVVLYAAVGGLMCLSWLLVFHVLTINPHLLEAHVEPTFFPRERHRALFGVALYTFSGITGWALSPTLALLFFLALPVFYGITSEGLVETRTSLLRRLDTRRSQREGLRRRRTATAATDVRK
jgi:TMEM175 potassium channel family protein